MRRTSFANTDCPLAGALEIVGDWWTMLIIREALSGSRRFDEIQERLGIARNVLTRRLRHLEQHGILERRPYQQRPVRHEYVLTEKGRDLGIAVMALAQWGNRWKTAGSDAAPVRFHHARTGAPLEARVIDTTTGEEVGYADTVVTLPDGEVRHPGGAAD